MLKSLLVSLDEILTKNGYGKKMVCQVNILIKFLVRQFSSLVTNTVSAQIMLRDKPKQLPLERTKKIAGNIGKNLGAIQASLKKTKNQVRNLKKIFEQ